MRIAGFFSTLVNIIFSVVELFIAARIIFKLLGANPYTPFVGWIYGISSGLIYPFANIFPSPVLRGGFVLEIPALVALLVYAVIAYIIFRLIETLSYKRTSVYTTS
jgi:YggT family protein